MKFLVDAHIPKRLTIYLRAEGHDAIHTLDLPLKNQTPDSTINKISMDEQHVVVTKDADFIDSHLLRGEPYKLLLVSTGNIRNSDLLQLFRQNMGQIIEALQAYSYIELNSDCLTIHL